MTRISRESIALREKEPRGMKNADGIFGTVQDSRRCENAIREKASSKFPKSRGNSNSPATRNSEITSQM